MIAFEGFSFSYGKELLLEDVNIEAKSGEITVILGHNGSGKTTLMNSVFLTRGRGYDGKIIVNGTDIATLSPRCLSRLVGLMPQRLPSMSLTVRELVSLGRTPYRGAFGRLSLKDLDAIDRALSDMDIAALSDRRISTLSGGEKQSAYFAMLLAKDTEHMLLDEPVSALDIPSRQRLLSFIRLLRSRGKSVLAVMHDLNDAISIADRIYVIDGATASLPMSAEEFASSDYPSRVFSVSAHRVSTDGGERTVFLPQK